MALFVDARIPVVFADLATVTRDDAVLLEGDEAAPAAAAIGRFAVGCLADAPLPHQAGCVCCLPRGAVAEALGRLFLARVRGEVGFFHRVVACVQDHDAVRAALADDALVAARFRLA